MNNLLRQLAPLSDAAWTMIDDEARERLVPRLAARRLVDFSGPHGWSHSATNLGRTEPVTAAPCEGVHGLRRRVLALVELRAPFDVARAELRDADRGADDADLADLDRAVHGIAVAENKAVFHGWPEASIQGIAECSPYEHLALGESTDDYPRPVAAAVEQLLQGGISGPYALALGGEQYRRVVQTGEHGGYPLLEHLRKILEGPIVWTPGVRGAIVLSVRGGDFLLESGQDLSVGYDAHDRDSVQLYLEESFSFRVVTPEAAVVLEA